ETRVYGFHRLYPSWLFPGRSQLDPSPSPPVDVEARRWLIPWWPFSWRRVQRDWAAWRPDTVVIQWWVPFMAPMTAWLASRARRLGIRVTMVCHNVLPHERSRLDTTLVRMALSRADRLIVHSIVDRTQAQALLPDCAVEVAPFPSYADVRSTVWSRERARAGVGVDGRVLLFFGFVRPYKGLMDLLDALPAVLAELDVTLLVVGEIWGEAESYHDRVKTLGLDSRVRFFDRYVSNDEMAMFFAAADLVVLPYREATGSAALQLAFGFGVPVVATKTGSMAQAVDDGQTGFLVEAGDVNGLSRVIVRFFREGRAAEFRHNIRQNQKRFTWEAVTTAALKPIQLA
ncbi:MAG TPA: glycosyltransferase, partial [Anaerolineae bacterium]|nr:glycosyltransferase [Anaerolineae bacterium]